MTSPGPRERTRRDVPWLVPAWVDPVVARATGVIGGPVGRYAVIGGRGLAGVAAALSLLGAALVALGVWQRGHCLMKGWSTPDQFWRACYSDLTVVHVSSPLVDGRLPWSGEIPSTQPPLSGLAMWLVSLVVPGDGAGLATQQGVFAAWAVICVLALTAGSLAVVALRPRRPWQAAQLAASPVLITLALLSTDVLGVALTVLALWAWGRRRGWLAGALLGLALLVRPFPLLVLAAIVILSLRAPLPGGKDDAPAPGRDRLLVVGQVVVGALLAALAVVVPLVLVEPQALTAATAWWRQEAGYGALQVVPRLMGTPLLPVTTIVIAVAGWLLAIGLGVWLARRPGRRPGVAQLAAAMTAVVALTAPSLSVQSGLWVLIFLALSARPWWEHLVWAFVETLHGIATWLHIAFASDPGRGLPPEAYALVVTLRAAAWVWILWRIWDEPDPGLARRPGRARHLHRPEEAALQGRPIS